MISLPHNLLKEIDGFVEKNGSGDRSECIKEAMLLYLQKKRKQEIKENLRNGYIEMSEINLKLAAEVIEYDSRIMTFYDECLAECE
jgi:CopG family transcriptional regulator/antitoxin EndoAI